MCSFSVLGHPPSSHPLFLHVTVDGLWSAIGAVHQCLICHLCFKWQREWQLCSETGRNFNSLLYYLDPRDAYFVFIPAKHVVRRRTGLTARKNNGQAARLSVINVAFGDMKFQGNILYKLHENSGWLFLTEQEHWSHFRWLSITI